ncbi:hypothetical protein BN2476_270038 [Paraburkholderia piptadeniae]|uniref:Uncharacterized protein n=1 Tax=Paraburkholderia piptadeniae TaxID=1701573 RepID=A0A1N7S1M8_9BURK|nr:hypothetical protein BN2476_270038 [Paraburkholderia piptadeniae]
MSRISNFCKDRARGFLFVHTAEHNGLGARKTMVQRSSSPTWQLDGGVAILQHSLHDT